MKQRPDPADFAGDVNDPFYQNVSITMQNLKSKKDAGDLESVNFEGPGKNIISKSRTDGKSKTLTEGEVLNHIHNLRQKAFDKRQDELMNQKPFLPMLSTDEKELIMEQYFAGKKKMNKI